MSAAEQRDRTALQGEIDATDRDIDRLVHHLYGKSEGEIAIVEGTSAATGAASDESGEA